jgi:glycosyltransferase involved in cell wall biosynthesis
VTNFRSEPWPASNWNAWPGFLGIRIGLRRQRRYMDEALVGLRVLELMTSMIDMPKETTNIAELGVAPASVMRGDTAGNVKRIFFDLTTNAMWSGSPVGIVRVEGKLARWALKHLDTLEFAFFDPQKQTFCHLGRGLAARLITQDFIDTESLFDPVRTRKRKTDRIPAVLRPIAKWLLQSRRTSLQALERLRLKTVNPKFAEMMDRVQRAIMNNKYRTIMVNKDGSRRGCYPIDLVRGPPIELTSRDTLVCSGAGWAYHNINAIAERKRSTGFRLVVLCYDIIPSLFPHYFKPADAEAHRNYFNVVFPLADLVVFNSHTVEADARAFCVEHGTRIGATAVFRLGANGVAMAGPQSLPAGLETAHFALFVSTIEPRKGHRMIYNVWLRLLAAGVPQKNNFKLVFAGRKGWLVDDLMAAIRTEAGSTLQVITDADDAMLATLYRNAAFCLYPSRYEGYGLPVVEAFSYGKAVLASTGGSLPEVVGDFSPCLDPEDEGVWLCALQSWIEEPEARATYEKKIQISFRHPDWCESAQSFFALVQDV